MPIYDIYSKRKSRAERNGPELYEYDVLPETLKTQIVQIWHTVIGIPSLNYYETDSTRGIYQALVNVLRREYGVFKLWAPTPDPNNSIYAHNELTQFFLSTGITIEQAIDVIEIVFKCLDKDLRQSLQYRAKIDDAIAELNFRFDEHGIGYQYTDGVMIRRDSEFVHKEVVIPTLLVLRNPRYNTAQVEFLSAHAHYRSGNMSEALVDACKSFESTMKIIAVKHKWDFDQNKPASHLIDICLNNGLIPSYWQAHFTHLRGVLGSSVPVARNKEGGHGAGTEPAHDPPRALVAYVLHMTAATILFLTEAEKAIP